MRVIDVAAVSDQFWSPRPARQLTCGDECGVGVSERSGMSTSMASPLGASDHGDRPGDCPPESADEWSPPRPEGVLIAGGFWPLTVPLAARPEPVAGAAPAGGEGAAGVAVDVVGPDVPADGSL